MKPYAAAYRAVRAADYVVVDSNAGAFLRDIVRFKAPVTRPIVLDLAYLPTSTLRAICRKHRTMLFDRRQVDTLGKPAPSRLKLASSTMAERRGEMEQLGCTTPVPLD